MYEVKHTQEINGKIYESNLIKSAVRVKTEGKGTGKYLSFARSYGNKRTKEEAIRLVKEWEDKHPHQYKVRK